MAGMERLEDRHRKKKFAKDFYNSAQWIKVRELALKRDKYLCQDCLARNMIVPAEEVHHIIKLTPTNLDDPEITLNLDNLICLCHNCHTSRHAKKRRYRIDEMGNVICL